MAVTDMVRTADVSDDPDRCYRYELGRAWDDRRHRITWIMLNPSVTDGKQDDPTIRKCVEYALRWGYGSLTVVNLYAWRATDPRELLIAYLEGHDIIGPRNDRAIRRAVDVATRVVCAWGTHRMAALRHEPVLRILHAASVARSSDSDWIRCLGTTSNGNPRHPGRLPYATPLIPYPGAAAHHRAHTRTGP